MTSGQMKTYKRKVLLTNMLRILRKHTAAQLLHFPPTHLQYGARKLTLSRLCTQLQQQQSFVNRHDSVGLLLTRLTTAITSSHTVPEQCIFSQHCKSSTVMVEKTFQEHFVFLDQIFNSLVLK